MPALWSWPGAVMRKPETDTSQSRRRATHVRGISGESLALVALLFKGYRPLGRRYRAGGGEIDLIVKRGRTIAFVEVKARALLFDAQVAIDARKRARFSRAVRVWLSRHPPRADVSLRVDAVFVARGRWPTHLVDAFPIEGL